MLFSLVLGILAILIGLIGYYPYFRDIFKGKTKPHAFSWLVWGILTAIAFFGQETGKGGAGAWVTGFTALVCFAIFALSLRSGNKQFPMADWLCLAGCGVSLILWILTKSPLISIVLITLIDAIAFIPTFRKSYRKPNDETEFTYIMSGIKFVLGIVALQKFSIITVLYPASLVVTNSVFVVMVIARKAKLIGSKVEAS